MLFFGYTNCPDTCPITLGKMNTVLNRMGTDASQVQFVMITVDPERDTPAKIGDYVRTFNPKFIGLSGSADEIAAAAAEFGIYYQKVPGNSPTTYSMNHTASILVLNRQGAICLIWPSDIQAADAAADLRTLLRNK
jgi:protein SCO1/2